VANYPSAIKRNRQAPRRRLRNRLVLSNVRTAVRKARHAAEVGEGDKVAFYKEAIRRIDKAVNKGILKRATASRQISRLTRAFKAAE